MTLHIPLSPETETKLREYAAAGGRDVADVVLEALREKLADVPVAANGQPATSPQQRIAALHRWAAEHDQLSYEVDDSRESIYDGRGE